LNTLANEETFARKAIPSSNIWREDIDKEAQNIAKLIKYGEHENIVRILDYGWASNFFFIDMELCDFALSDYIKYHEGGGSIGFIDMSLFAPVLATKDCSLLERVRNMWVIGTHITSGLEFLHSHKHVHRDLKPANGMNFSTRF
jgi:serine/threonine protein kinase